MPCPYFANYSATKVFNDRLSLGLYYELKSKGIDVLSVMPGVVPTNINGADDKFLATATVSQCAQGILRNATSQITYGAGVHELHGFFSKLLSDVLPYAWLMNGTKLAAGSMRKLFKLKA